MRALKDANAFLPGDLGVRKGAAALGLPTSPRALVDYSRRWEPYRAYAVMYLWTAAG
jgi:AraC family transcriptional regulator of adaptative response / DNA-3-methyladenine glycosylase II